MRFATFALVAVLATPGLTADTAERDKACQFQSEVVGAVQTARLDRVRKDDAVKTVVAANPSWPAGVDTAVAPVVDFVYDMRRRDLKKVDLARDTLTQCVENWEQLKAMQESLSSGS